jgi:hypothetical protein
MGGVMRVSNKAKIKTHNFINFIFNEFYPALDTSLSDLTDLYGDRLSLQSKLTIFDA